MHSSLWLTACLAIGAAAAPLENRAIKVIDVVDTITVTLRPGEHAPTQAPKPVVPAPVPAPAPKPAAPAPSPQNGGGFLEGSQPAPKPAPASGGSSGAPANGDMLSVVNKWRRAYNVQELTWNHAMDDNVREVGENGHGVNEIHKLIPGMAMGQVITPGEAHNVGNAHGYSAFEVAYIAWLCEVPSDAQLQADANNGVDVCQMVNEVLHMEYSDRGHHDILVNGDYSGVSCGYTANPNANQETSTYQGLYICDLSS